MQHMKTPSVKLESHMSTGSGPGSSLLVFLGREQKVAQVLWLLTPFEEYLDEVLSPGFSLAWVQPLGTSGG